MPDKTPPPNIHVWQLGIGFANSSVINALIQTGVIDELGDTAKTLDQLAGRLKLNRDVLFRVLRFAISLDILSVDNSLYSLSESGRYLLEGIPGSVRRGLELMGTEPWRKSWNNLVSSMKNGQASFTNTMGEPFFEYLKAHPDNAALFNSWMTANSNASADVIPVSYDFTPFDTVCDIAGGHGRLLKSILLAHPKLHGILFDMETVVKDHMLTELGNRVTIVGGDFFIEVPKADVLIMKHIIHDWNDDKAIQILKTCRKSMGQNSRLLILERVIKDGSDSASLFLDLHMQVMVGGKERTADEFDELLRRSELHMKRIIPTSTPVNIIEAAI